MSRWWLLPLLVFVLAMACGTSPRYESPPDPSWKERFAYCYSIVADPAGERNTRYAWADKVDVDRASAHSTARMTNVRVSPKLGSLSRSGNHNEDFFSPEVIWTVEDGSLNITKRAHCGGGGATLE